MTITNDTTTAAETLQEQEVADQRALDLLVVETLPEIVATAERFKERAAKGVAYTDFLAQVDAVIAAAMYFAGDEFKAINPVAYSGADDFESSDHLGFSAMGRYLFLRLLAEHPEVLTAAAERAKAALWRALMDGTLPAEFDR